MRPLPLLTLVLSLTGSSLAAQRSYDQDKMKANFAAMQTHSWFTGGSWITDLETAKAKAKASGKPIFAYFTRTYAP